MKEVIEELGAAQVLDSRGRPTLWAYVVGSQGSRGEAMVPSGASCGSREALELRDGGPSWQGLSVHRAIANIEDQLKPQLIGVDLREQALIDEVLQETDGTETFSRMGANATLALSMACARAGAVSSRLPLYRYLGGSDARSLPMPMLNLLNGGRHSDGLIDLQELMVRPVGARSLSEALEWSVRLSSCLKKILREKGLSTGVGDEGGFAPDLESDRAGLDLLLLAIEEAGLTPGLDVRLALDVAASELYCAKEQCYYEMKRKERGEGEFAARSRSEQIAYYEKLCEDYPIDSIEDGLHEDDWEGWSEWTSRMGERIQLVGDDLLVTQGAYLRKAHGLGAANAILIKPNQVGTVSLALEVAFLAQRLGYGVVISHRSGETEDSFIADLAVATGAGQIKTGAPVRSDRLAKYNRLLLIEQELGARARFEDGRPMARGGGYGA